MTHNASLPVATRSVPPLTMALASGQCSLTCCHKLSRIMHVDWLLSPMVITGLVGTQTTLHPLLSNGTKVLSQISDLLRVAFISFFSAFTITVSIVPLLDHAWCLIFHSHPQPPLERFYSLPYVVTRNRSKRMGQQACWFIWWTAYHNLRE